MTFEETRVVIKEGTPMLMHNGRVLYVPRVRIAGTVTEAMHRAMWKRYLEQLTNDQQFLKSIGISPIDNGVTR